MSKKNRFGQAFIDQLAKVSNKNSHYHKGKDTNSVNELFISGRLFSTPTQSLSIWRQLILMIFCLVLFFSLFLRLFHLQVVEGAKNRELADSNRIEIKIIHAPRGVIYDRNGVILAQNEPGFRLINKEATQSAGRYKYIPRDEALKMEVDNLTNQTIEVDNLRSYSLGEKSAHILGYISEITDTELKDPKFSNYKPGDRIGRGGVEEIYEKVLKGVDGGEVIEVDAQGKKIRTLRENKAIPGQNLYLTIDANLQEHAYKKLSESVSKSKSCCGAVVATDPSTGQILALASIPSYNPKQLAQALLNPNSPLLNRAIAGTYPPGSTYKIASSLAGLESGKITAKTIFHDTGVVQLGPYKFANWYFTQYGKTEGPVDVITALKRSNDIYYYLLGQTIGEDIMADTSRKLGLGKILGVDLPGEAAGIIPDNNWKQANIGESWYPGDTLHMSIGQGFILTTPLQIVNLVSVIANDGKQFPPHLALKITSPQNHLIKEFQYQNIQQNSFKKDNLQLIRTGLELVPKEGGTAWPFFNFPIPTAGKTGTAEFGHPKNKTHAWYTAYAPTTDPKIAVTVLIEEGGEGSTDASPVAKEIFRFFFSPDKNNLIKDTTPISSSSARTVGD